MNPTEPQIRRLYAIAKSKGWSHDGVKRMLEMNYKVKSSKDLTLEQYDAVCLFLEKSNAPDIVSMGKDKNTLDLFPPPSHERKCK